jgi:hypothetical protein
VFDADTYYGLVMCCADGPTAEIRAQAHYLLATEQTARLRASTRDYEHSGTHPAFRDLALTSEGLRGGPDAGRYYAFHENGIIGGSVPRTPAGGYDLILAAATLLAAPLLSATLATYGISKYTSERRFLRRGDVAPGAAFGMDPLFDRPVAADITLPPGTWHIQFDGQAWSRSTDASPNVSIDVCLDGTPDSTHTVVRDSASIATPADRVVVPVTFTIDETIIIAAPAVLTLENSGASNERARGILRLFDEA